MLNEGSLVSVRPDNMGVLSGKMEQYNLGHDFVCIKSANRINIIVIRLDDDIHSPAVAR